MLFIKKTIVIIEDNPDVRNGLQWLINTSELYFVIDTFDSCEDALDKIISLCPDIILMDIDLPGMDGIEGTRQVKAILPKCEILMITIFENSARVFEALCAGATGYLTKNSGQRQILDALDEMASGGAPMSANIARMVVKSFQKSSNNILSDKEQQVLTLLSDGKSYKTIAFTMEVSLDTTKFHIKNIYTKLQVNNREDAISYARKKNWI